MNKNVVRSYDLYLPKYKEIEYTKLTEEEKDIRMFTCESWDEMKELANGNEERTAVMKELEKILNDPVFAASYDGELYDKGLREEYKALGFEQGLEEGHAQGLEEGFNDAIKQSIVNLYENDAFRINL